MRARPYAILLGVTAAGALLGSYALSTAISPGPAGAQSALSLALAPCTEVNTGDDFTIDVQVSNVTGLNAWEVYFSYDPHLLEVTARNARLLLDAAPNSNVFDFSDPVPNTTGFYRLGAADLSTEANTAESGSGILASITLHALDDGVSWAALYRGDLNGDGKVDFGPTLTGERGAHIGDSDGDGIFDGPLRSGQVAIGGSCASTAPTAPPPQGTVAVVPSITPAVSTPRSSPDTPGQASGTATPATSPDRSASPTLAASAGTVDATGGNSGDGGGGSGFWVIAVIIAAAVVVAFGAAGAIVLKGRTR
jgi:hypothetical protein